MYKLNYYVNKNCREFFDKIHDSGMDLTFDDVLLKPRYSEVLPSQTNVYGYFSKNIFLKNALVSAAMDTVTESNLAIAIAKKGGIGVIHKNMSPEIQALEVKKVKTELHGKIDNPVTLKENITLGDVKNLIKDNNYSFNTFPILDDNKKLIGLLTNKIYKFNLDNSKKLNEIMIKNVLTADENTTIEEAYNLMIKNQNGVLPLTDKNNVFKGLYIFSDVERIVNGERTNFTVDEKGRLRVAAAISVLKDHGSEWQRIDLLVKNDVDALVIDSAHAHTKTIIYTLNEIKKKYPKMEIIVGNVSTPEAVKNLIENGVDGIKVGQGPGSICTTRIVTGSGSAQLSAIYDCAKAAYGKVPIIADGGIRYSGDLVKAFAAGANSIMLGSLFASCSEAPGDVVKINGVEYRVYRGMGSIGSMNKWKGSRERYGQDNKTSDKMVAEGIEGKVLVRGPLSFVFDQLIGGVQSGLGNNGAKDIKELQENACFRKISPAGLRESHPHDISFVEDAPNYKLKN